MLKWDHVLYFSCLLVSSTLIMGGKKPLLHFLPCLVQGEVFHSRPLRLKEEFEPVFPKSWIRAPVNSLSAELESSLSSVCYKTLSELIHHEKTLWLWQCIENAPIPSPCDLLGCFCLFGFCCFRMCQCSVCLSGKRERICWKLWIAQSQHWPQLWKAFM